MGDYLYFEDLEQAQKQYEADGLDDTGHPFEPDWATPPGETIAELRANSDMDFSDLEEALDIGPVDCLNLMDGRLAITPDLAEKLSSVFGPSAQFWLNREAQYRESVARIYKKGLIKASNNTLGYQKVK